MFTLEQEVKALSHRDGSFEYAQHIEGLAQNYCICILHIFQEKQNLSYFNIFMNM